ncbi:MAG TPA: 4'-phosphopantetheinyl transferase superfamily protein [Syntrophomonadaceae bacterium]|nr:4'-phosphopantetheinyl transferase superfamily protein [Syntrophomonadaceae bacterium]HPR92660.1 4'-phosphopantetheinyl transferase superfamily protein [Syntrophomonadaceae bacterium]
MVEVFALNITDTSRLDQMSYLLAPEKQLRLEKIKDPVSARQVLSSDLLARAVVCDKLGWRNNEIEFCYNDYGKPSLLHKKDFHFNLSHSGNWVVMAISTYEVGIDIEQIVPLDLSIAEHFFSSYENRYLNSLPPALQLDGFFRIWTLKESYIKMTGQGLSADLTSFSVQLEGKTGYPQLLTDKPNKFYFRNYALHDNYKLAVCAREKSFAPHINIINSENLIRMFIFS